MSAAKHTPGPAADELDAALDNLAAAVAFRRKVTEASERGEAVMHTGAFSDALEWLHSAAFRVADARAAITKATGSAS